MRRFLSFDCAGDTLAATLDEANGATGLLIVSGGNEIRAGGHANQSRLAAWAAAQGYPAFRYDRPGVGDSAGENRGFLHGGEAIRSAIAAFRRECPQLTHLVGFGNCDAATSLLFTDTELDALVIANPWLIEPSSDPPPGEDAHSMPSSAAIRARYIARLKNPSRLARDLFGGAIDLKKFARGLSRLRTPEAPSALSDRAATALADIARPTDILIAKGDSTALVFQAAWKTLAFAAARTNAQVRLDQHPTSSHSFADGASQAWLRQKLLAALTGAEDQSAQSA